MSPDAERRLLQAVVAVASLVPLTMGLASVIRGPAARSGVDGPVPGELDSHFRYVSGLLLGGGRVFAACIPAIERRGAIFRVVGAVVIAGGLARLVSLFAVGLPGPGHRFGLTMELGVVPLILLWQTRVARRYGS